ncbi:amidohydrolase family protein [Nocardioides sp. TF02-7]|uniref:amidohydrolase n=1 Tax=Nocardioides sp. TF02-7 TaxID=2917724 RepID=UPI001F06176E|nr:amidohydrolase family protein [Nocardioides sp. TF02-7]UMG94565.1 amidohydrolase family protein [Nocardioides sp. TF02-7]
MTALLIRRARLVPVRPGDEAPPHPVDVLVEDGVVTRVAEDVGRPPGAEVVDAGGRWVSPGLWDAHVHLGQWTLASHRLDTSALRSPEEAVHAVAQRVAAEPGRPVVGWGHRPGSWEREGTATELDEITGVTPVVLIAGDGHHAWLNSAAQAALGLELRDDVVREAEWFAAYERLAALVPDDLGSPAAYRETLRRAAALGVVGIVDFEFGGDVEAWRRRWPAGADLLRVRTAVYAETLDDVVAEGLRTGDLLLPGDDRLTMGPLKIISDGSLNTRTAWCHEPYVEGDHPQPAGAPNVDPAGLTELLARAHRAGLEVATHAIGDAAVDAALAAYETTGARGSVEHVQLVAREAVGRLARLGLRASVQPHHLVDDRDLTEQVWGDRAHRAYAFRWLLDAGVTTTLGSDAPVSPLDPWLAIDAAVRRTGDDRPAWHPEHALTRQEALACSVDGQPTVGPGSRGDLVVLDDDPLTATRPPVVVTVVAGRVVHRA